MPLELQKEATILRIRTSTHTLEGENMILNALLDNPDLTKGVRCIEIDLDSLHFINYPGLSELLAIYDIYCKAPEHGLELRFLNVDRKVMAILELADMAQIADITSKL